MDSELAALMAKFRAVQSAEGDASRRLNERHAAEVLIHLLNRSRRAAAAGDTSVVPLELLYTTDGREVLTSRQLEKEIFDEVEASGGRMNVVDLPSALFVDITHVERAVAEVLSDHAHTLRLIDGELISERYLEGVLEDIHSELALRGTASVTNIARASRLSSAFVFSLVVQWQDAGRLKNAKHFGDDSSVLYTDEYLAGRYRKVLAILSALSRPVDLTVIAARSCEGDAMLQNSATLAHIAADVCQRGWVAGRVDGTRFMPSAFQVARDTSIDNTFRSNELVAYSYVVAHGVGNPKGYLQTRYNQSSAIIAPQPSTVDGGGAESTTAKSQKKGTGRRAAAAAAADQAAQVIPAAGGHLLAHHFLAEKKVAALVAAIDEIGAAAADGTEGFAGGVSFVVDLNVTSAVGTSGGGGSAAVDAARAGVGSEGSSSQELASVSGDDANDSNLDGFLPRALTDDDVRVLVEDVLPRRCPPLQSGACVIIRGRFLINLRRLWSSVTAAAVTLVDEGLSKQKAKRSAGSADDTAAATAGGNSGASKGASKAAAKAAAAAAPAASKGGYHARRGGAAAEASDEDDGEDSTAAPGATWFKAVRPPLPVALASKLELVLARAMRCPSDTAGTALLASSVQEVCLHFVPMIQRIVDDSSRRAEERGQLEERTARAARQQQLQRWVDSLRMWQHGVAWCQQQPSPLGGGPTDAAAVFAAIEKGVLQSTVADVTRLIVLDMLPPEIHAKISQEKSPAALTAKAIVVDFVPKTHQPAFDGILNAASFSRSIAAYLSALEALWSENAISVPIKALNKRAEREAIRTGVAAWLQAERLAWDHHHITQPAAGAPPSSAAALIENGATAAYDLSTIDANASALPRLLCALIAVRYGALLPAAAVPNKSVAALAQGLVALLSASTDLPEDALLAAAINGALAVVVQSIKSGSPTSGAAPAALVEAMRNLGTAVFSATPTTNS